MSYGKGRVSLNVSSRNTITRIVLSDVLYVFAMTNRGYSVTFEKENATVLREDGSTVVSATRKGRMYIMKTTQQHYAMMADKSIVAMKLWHERYGHLNLNDLRKLKINKMVSGLDIPPEAINIPCEICNRAKIHALPHRVSETRTKNTLELIHTDICGPMNVTSMGGARYFVTSIDDKTYTEVVMLKKRSEVFDAFKKYVAKVEREQDRKIIKVRSDNAKEYTSKEFNEFLEAAGIRREFSVEYTPQQNSVAERANRTIVEMARCMLLQSGVPTSLWAEAVNTAVFLRNRCPSRAAVDKTPLELWSGKKPDVKNLKTFGSHVTALKKGPGISKWDAKGEDLIMVGYNTESKAYRLWRKGSTSVIKSYDVRFIEDSRFVTQESTKYDTITSSIRKRGN